MAKESPRRPKILVFDIETAPITAYTWGLFDERIGLNQIKEDWHLLAWAAKWYGDPASKVMYMDNRHAKKISDDKKLVKKLSDLLNQADGVITQNGKSFDVKKVNARAVINGLPPIKPPVNHTDILREGRKVFSFTSHRLEYISNTINKKYKKLLHKEYPGFELWKAVLTGNKHAWDVMKKYAIHDVLATEEAVEKIRGWIKTQRLSTYTSNDTMHCKCGSTDLEKRGYAHTDYGKYQIYKCKACGKWPRGSVNLLSTEKKKNILRDK